MAAARGPVCGCTSSIPPPVCDPTTVRTRSFDLGAACDSPEVEFSPSTPLATRSARRSAASAAPTSTFERSSHFRGLDASSGVSPRAGAPDYPPSPGPICVPSARSNRASPSGPGRHFRREFLPGAACARTVNQFPSGFMKDRYVTTPPVRVEQSTGVRRRHSADDLDSPTACGRMRFLPSTLFEPNTIQAVGRRTNGFC